MRVLVLGHSDSDGKMLPDRSLAWPRLLEHELAARFENPSEVAHRRVLPLRSDVLQSVETTLRDLEPEVVILSLNPYGFAIQLVSLKIEQHFGPRAGRIYKRIEEGFDRLTRERFLLGGLNSVARRLGRRLLGVASLASYDAVVESYSAILHRLAREENLQVIVMGGSRLSDEIQRLNPGMVEKVDQFASELRQVTETHRLTWFNTEASVAGRDRASLFFPDGVHRTPEAHRRLADMLLPVVAAALSAHG